MQTLVWLLYNGLLPILFVLTFPAWLLKMAKRGGLSVALLERFGFFRRAAEFEKQGAVYMHAVSVGEVFIALKLIKQWLVVNPGERILLVPTTATGYAVAKEQAPEGVRVIYSPLDFWGVLSRVFNRFKPKHIVLLESEIWPNMLHIAAKRNIPVSIANARLSERSERRYLKLSGVVQPLFKMLHTLCVQNEIDRKRWLRMGVSSEKLVVTGSIKYDHDSGSKPKKNPEKGADFEQMLSEFGGKPNKPIVMVVSTHAGEEAWIAEALWDLRERVRLVFVPRHSERRIEVVADLANVGYTAALRSKKHSEKADCLVIDSTGELQDWITHADVAIIGKSFLGRGGQNPAEAIAAKIPVIVGPYMQNFEPLISELKQAGGVIESSAQRQSLQQAVASLIDDENAREKQIERALHILYSHKGATERTVLELC